VALQQENRREAGNGRRRGQIMTAAMAVFSRLGYDGATMANVAAEAGVAVGTIYNYFPSKRDLLEAIADSYVIAPFREIVENRSGDDLEFLAAVMENRLSLGIQDASRFLALFNEIQRDPALRKRYAEEALGPIMGALEDYVKQRTADGTFRELDPAVTVRAVGGMFIGFLLITRMEGDRTPVDLSDRARLAREMAHLVLEGVRCR
jgi:AcrR family transcriptional regulator